MSLMSLVDCHVRQRFLVFLFTLVGDRRVPKLQVPEFGHPATMCRPGMRGLLHSSRCGTSLWQPP
jgi:hypothetical protein